MLFPVFFVFVFLTHFTLLRLPYYWDEAGYYVPAAYDFFRTGSLVPISTLSNAHPPLPSILLAAWWHLSGFVPSGTRTAMCMVTAFGLVGVYSLARVLSPAAARYRIAAAATLLTALYPVWFAQSTLANADMFAAAFTLWGLRFYFDRGPAEYATPNRIRPGRFSVSRFGTHLTGACVFFSLAALSKETAIVTPLSLALYEIFLALRGHQANDGARSRLKRAFALLLPALPLAAWFAYHRHRTGFIFGNPEYFRYNATANFSARHAMVAFSQRLIHVFFHMNMFVPVLCMLAAMLLPPLLETTQQEQSSDNKPAAPLEPPGQLRPRIPLPSQAAIGVVLIGNLMFFSIMGGALLTRYLLPLYPLVLLVCVATWRRRVRHWELLVAFTAMAFLAGIFINPPYRFAPEDNLNYSDMIVLQQQAIGEIVKRWPEATVLTAWPATDELSKTELGYVLKPVRTVHIENFSLAELEKADAAAGSYDTALIFSTRFGSNSWLRWKGCGGIFSTSPDNDFQSTLTPREAAMLLHGSVAWQASRNGVWAAVLRFPRAVDARLNLPGHDWATIIDPCAKHLHIDRPGRFYALHASAAIAPAFAAELGLVDPSRRVAAWQGARLRF